MTSRDIARVDGARFFRLLFAAERLMLWLILGFGLAAVALTVLLGRTVNWPPFLIGYFATLGLTGIGIYVRQVKNAPRIALAIIGVAIFMGFTAVSTIFIFALFPLPNPPIDNLLIRIDAQFGYHWPSFVGWLALTPGAAKALGWVYHTSIPQIVLTVILLAALRRERALHRLLLVGIVSLIITVAIWWLWPSVGPSASQMIPEDIRLATGLYFNPKYGAYLSSLVEVGPRRISPEVITGVVAFPSYHMIMACMVVYFTSRTPMFVPALLLNTAMIPATLSHGGHHLVDLLGGVIVFAASVWVCRRIVPDPD